MVGLSGLTFTYARYDRWLRRPRRIRNSFKEFAKPLACLADRCQFVDRGDEGGLFDSKGLSKATGNIRLKLRYGSPSGLAATNQLVLAEIQPSQDLVDHSFRTWIRQSAHTTPNRTTATKPSCAKAWERGGPRVPRTADCNRKQAGGDSAAGFSDMLRPRVQTRRLVDPDAVAQRAAEPAATPIERPMSRR